jgi:nucleotide-binding universal stress UspA family protein
MNATAHAAGAAETAGQHGPAARHVLIAVDDTERGRHTLRSGLAQAAAQDADVTVLHIVAPRQWRLARLGQPRAIPVRVRDPLESAVLREARRAAFEHGICPRLELIASDDPHAIILAMARRVGASTIVVGANRPDSLVAPLGVCQGVLRRAAVPVFVVPG